MPEVNPLLEIHDIVPIKPAWMGNGDDDYPTHPKGDPQMTEYCVAALVKGLSINCELRLVLSHLQVSDRYNMYVTPH